MANDDLTGRVALVTGASRGIGHGTAMRLAQSGVDVAIAYHGSRQSAQALRDSIIALGRRAISVGGDVADPEQIERLVGETEQALGPIDILVSNAGRVQPLTLPELTLETWDQTMREHVRAAFLLAQRVAPGMCSRQWGRIVLVSSIAAFTGGFVGPHYSTAKAALIGLMHSLSASLAPHGVTANVVAPSLIETDALSSLDKNQRRKLVASIPAGRFGTVEEAADIIVMLLGNGYLSGQTLLHDGGRYPR